MEQMHIAKTTESQSLLHVSAKEAGEPSIATPVSINITAARIWSDLRNAPRIMPLPTSKSVATTRARVCAHKPCVFKTPGCRSLAQCQHFNIDRPTFDRSSPLALQDAGKRINFQTGMTANRRRPSPTAAPNINKYRPF
jgi:hypothetical protein